MKTYNKRIGFLVSYQTLVPHGGIGQFTKSFIRLMEENNVKVDIITDKKPQDNEFIKSLNTNIIYPEESYGYTNHSAILSPLTVYLNGCRIHREFACVSLINFIFNLLKIA